MLRQQPGGVLDDRWPARGSRGRAPRRARPGLPRWPSDVLPRGGRPRRGALGDVAEHRRRPGRAAPADRAQLHRGEVLRLVEHDVAEAGRALEQVGRARRAGPRRRATSGRRPWTAGGRCPTAAARCSSAREQAVGVPGERGGVGEQRRSSTAAGSSAGHSDAAYRLAPRRCRATASCTRSSGESPAALHLQQHARGRAAAAASAGPRRSAPRGRAARRGSRCTSYAGTRHRRDPRGTTRASSARRRRATTPPGAAPRPAGRRP